MSIVYYRGEKPVPLGDTMIANEDANCKTSFALLASPCLCLSLRARFCQ